MDNLIDEILKGIFLSILFYYSTLTDEINIINVFKFTIFYIAMIFGALYTGIQTNVITSAFLTKTVFTLIDERIKKPKTHEKLKS